MTLIRTNKLSTIDKKKHTERGKYNMQQIKKKTCLEDRLNIWKQVKAKVARILRYRLPLKPTQGFKPLRQNKHLHIWSKD